MTRALKAPTLRGSVAHLVDPFVFSGDGIRVQTVRHTLERMP